MRRSHAPEASVMKSTSVAIIVVALTAVAAAKPGAADEATPPDTAGGRFIFVEQADGYLRLDTQSGAVALCRQHAVGWACTAAPEDRAVLEDEIARLRAENAALKQGLSARALPLPPGGNPQAPSQPPAANPQAQSQPPAAQNGQPQASEPKVRSPYEAEIDRMIAFVGRVWHRFVDAVNRAQQRILNKS